MLRSICNTLCSSASARGLAPNASYSVYCKVSTIATAKTSSFCFSFFSFFLFFYLPFSSPYIFGKRKKEQPGFFHGMLHAGDAKKNLSPLVMRTEGMAAACC